MLKDHPYVGAVGRLLIAALFLISGLGKIAAHALTQGYIASAGLPFPLLAYLIAIVIEVGGGILLILGYQSRIVASVMASFLPSQRHSLFTVTSPTKTRWRIF